jgi:hypothetical protein
MDTFRIGTTMKTCPECGGQYKNLGSHMKMHNASIQAREQADEEAKPQKADEEAQPKAVRPIDRLNRKVVYQGQSGIIRR